MARFEEMPGTFRAGTFSADTFSESRPGIPCVPAASLTVHGQRKDA